jgi:hypothetical protein
VHSARHNRTAVIIDSVTLRDGEWHVPGTEPGIAGTP